MMRQKEKERGRSRRARTMPVSDQICHFLGRVQWKRKLAAVLVATFLTGTMADGLSAVGLGNYANAYAATSSDASRSDAVHLDSDDLPSKGSSLDYYLDGEEDTYLYLPEAEIWAALEALEEDEDAEELQLDAGLFGYDDPRAVVAVYDEIQKETKGYQLVLQGKVEDEEDLSYFVYAKPSKKKTGPKFDELQVVVLNLGNAAEEDSQYNVRLRYEGEELQLENAKVTLKEMKELSRAQKKAAKEGENPDFGESMSGGGSAGNGSGGSGSTEGGTISEGSIGSSISGDDADSGNDTGRDSETRIEEDSPENQAAEGEEQKPGTEENQESGEPNQEDASPDPSEETGNKADEAKPSQDDGNSDVNTADSDSANKEDNAVKNDEAEKEDSGAGNSEAAGENSESGTTDSDTGSQDSSPAGNDTGSQDSGAAGNDTGSQDSDPAGNDTGSQDSSPAGNDAGTTDTAALTISRRWIPLVAQPASPSDGEAENPKKEDGEVIADITEKKPITNGKTADTIEALREELAADGLKPYRLDEAGRFQMSELEMALINKGELTEEDMELAQEKENTFVGKLRRAAAFMLQREEANEEQGVADLSPEDLVGPDSSEYPAVFGLRQNTLAFVQAKTGVKQQEQRQEPQEIRYVFPSIDLYAGYETDVLEGVKTSPENIDVEGSSGESESYDIQVKITDIKAVDAEGNPSKWTYTPGMTKIKPLTEWMTYTVTYRAYYEKDEEEILLGEGEEKSYKVKIKGSLGEILDGDKAYVAKADFSDGANTELGMKAIVTGSADWDSDDEPGNDRGPDNAVVRTFDTVNYTMDMTMHMQAQMMENGFKQGRIYFEMLLPCSKEEAQFELKSMSWIDSYLDKDYHVVDSKYNGKDCQVLKGYFSTLPAGDKATIGEGMLQLNATIRVLNMQNGQTIEPIFTYWLDYNDVGFSGSDSSVEEYHRNAEAYLQNSELVYRGEEEKHACVSHQICEYRSVVAPPVTVSAAPRYNIKVKNGNETECQYIGELNFASGTDEAPNKEKGTVYGRLGGYGVTLQLYGKSKNSGLKGVEFPNESVDITFALKLSSEFKSGDISHNNNEIPYPLLYSFEEMKRDGGQKDGRSLPTIAQHPTYAGPFNQGDGGGSCKDGGAWSYEMDSQSGEIKVTIHGYHIDTSHFPHVCGGEDDKNTTYYDPKQCENYWEVQEACFSAGEVWVVQPYSLSDGRQIIDVYGGENKQGNFNVTLEASDLHMVSVSGQHQNGEGIAPDERVKDNAATQAMNQLSPGNFQNYVLYLKHNFSGYQDALVDGCVDNGKDWAVPGQAIVIEDYIMNDTAEGDNTSIAYDQLMKFDDTFFEVSGAWINTFGYREESGKILYGAKEDGKGWNHNGTDDPSAEGYDQEMILTSADGLVFYEDLQVLRNENKVCVAVLVEWRGTARPDSNHLHLYVNGTVKESAQPGKVYMVTHDAYGWTKNDVKSNAAAYVNKPADKLTDDDYTKYAKEEFPVRSKKIPYKEYPVPTNKLAGNVDSADNNIRHYEKAVYGENGFIKGSGGQHWGDSCLILSHKTELTHRVAQSINTFNLDSGFNVADFKITPMVERSKAAEGHDSQAPQMYADVYVELDSLDANLNIREEGGKIVSYVGDVYQQQNHGNYQGTFSGDPCITSEWYDDYKEADQKLGNWTFMVKRDEDGRIITMRWKLNHVEVNPSGITTLDPIYYSCNISPKDNRTQISLHNSAKIWSDQDVRIFDKDLAAAGNRADAGITAVRNSALNIEKQVKTPVVEAGSDMQFTAKLSNQGANPVLNNIVIDTVPYNNDNQGSKFTGKAIIKEYVTNQTGFTYYYTTDKKYQGQESAQIIQSIPEEQRKNQQDIAAWFAENGWQKAELSGNRLQFIPEEAQKSGNGIVAFAAIGTLNGGEVLQLDSTMVLPDAKPGDHVSTRVSRSSLQSQVDSRVVSRLIQGVVWLDNDKDHAHPADSASDWSDERNQQLSNVTVQLLQLKNGAYEEIVSIKTGQMWNGLSKQTEEYQYEEYLQGAGRGYYRFYNLPAGTYSVKFTETVKGDFAEYVAANVNAAVSDSVDSDAVPSYVGLSGASVKGPEEGMLKEAVIEGIVMPDKSSMQNMSAESCHNDFGIHIPESSLTISKIVADGKDGAQSNQREWRFKLDLTDKFDRRLTGSYRLQGGTIDGTGAAMPNQNNLFLSGSNPAEIVLKHGQSITITGLPGWVKYKVTEIKSSEDAVDFETTVKKNQRPSEEKAEITGSIPDLETDTAAFTNTRRLGSVTLQKVDGAGQGLAGAEFTLYAKKAGNTIQNLWRSVVGGDYEVYGTYPVDAAGNLTIQNLPLNQYYLVETKVPDGYIGETDGGEKKIYSFAITEDNWKTVQSIGTNGKITNTSQEFIIKKVAEETGGSLAGVEFTLYPAEGNAQIWSARTDDTDGTIKFTMNGLLPNTEYRLHEKDPVEGYLPIPDIYFKLVPAENEENPSHLKLQLTRSAKDSSGADNALVEGDSGTTLKVINRKAAGSLIFGKKTKDNQTVPAGYVQKFSFTVKLTPPEGYKETVAPSVLEGGDKIKARIISEGQDGQTVEYSIAGDGTITGIQLGVGEKVRFDGIYYGTHFRITEAQNVRTGFEFETATTSRPEETQDNLSGTERVTIIQDGSEKGAQGVLLSTDQDTASGANLAVYLYNKLQKTQVELTKSFDSNVPETVKLPEFAIYNVTGKAEITSETIKTDGWETTYGKPVETIYLNDSVRKEEEIDGKKLTIFTSRSSDCLVPGNTYQIVEILNYGEDDDVIYDPVISEPFEADVDEQNVIRMKSVSMDNIRAYGFLQVQKVLKNAYGDPLTGDTRVFHYQITKVGDENFTPITGTVTASQPGGPHLVPFGSYQVVETDENGIPYGNHGGQGNQNPEYIVANPDAPVEVKLDNRDEVKNTFTAFITNIEKPLGMLTIVKQADYVEKDAVFYFKVMNSRNEVIVRNQNGSASRIPADQFTSKCLWEIHAKTSTDYREENGSGILAEIGKLTATGLPYDTYTVIETDNEGNEITEGNGFAYVPSYQVQVEAGPAEGKKSERISIENKEITFTVTNQIKKTNVEITKTFTEGFEPNEDELPIFDIYQLNGTDEITADTDLTLSPWAEAKVGTVQITKQLDGTYRGQLKDDVLIPGYRYQAVETITDWRYEEKAIGTPFTAETASDEKGSGMTFKKTATLQVENQRTYGDLTVTKELFDYYGTKLGESDGDIRTFYFRIKDQNGSYLTIQTSGAEGADGKAGHQCDFDPTVGKITNAADDIYIHHRIPYGTYTVEEVGVTITEDGKVTITPYETEKKEGVLGWLGGLFGKDQENPDYHVSISVTGENTSGGSTADGSNPGGDTSDGTAGQGTAQIIINDKNADSAAVVIQNTERALGELTLTKQADYAGRGTRFYFQVTDSRGQYVGRDPEGIAILSEAFTPDLLWTITAGEDYSYTAEDNSAGTGTAGTDTAARLHQIGTLTTKGLPYGVYTVTETDQDGNPLAQDYGYAVSYQMKVYGEDSAVQAASELTSEDPNPASLPLTDGNRKGEVLITNRRSWGYLQIRKELQDNYGNTFQDKSRDFYYTVRNTQGESIVLPEEYQYNGNSQIGRITDDVVHRLYLPFGTYQVLETDSTGVIYDNQNENPLYAVTNPEAVTLSGANGDSAQAVIINKEKALGSLTLVKRSDLAYEGNTFYFQVENSRGEKIPMPDAEGNPTADQIWKIDVKQSVYEMAELGRLTIRNLPYGTYKVTEVSEDGTALSGSFRYQVSYETLSQGVSRSGQEGESDIISPAITVTVTNTRRPSGGGGNNGGGSSGGGGRTSRTSTPPTDFIPDADVPLGGADGGDGDAMTEILDEDVPLYGLPKTGDTSVPTAGILGIMLMSLLGAAGIIKKRKEEQ